MSDPRLVDMEPGGESTQYESIREFTKTPPKQTGQLGGGDKHTTSEVSPGLGKHSPASGNDEDFQAQKLGMGAVADSREEDTKRYEDDAMTKARRQQGYGPGSGVGA
ncbi:hypothetical protein E8E15_005787 [Penicillium rubens]|uniref:Pc20g14570 protein n=2 Tax=Penicillium chrysogenum species complex TaxID=254878 RepID=B6HHE1_PENRW|nr:uncharacterized protein N7525_009833 [Penicillium rubens]XP_056573486.1 uncharacterized protein N7489_003429 [Penicillium chrysogenum]CAP86786.1 Pc20g14570 [Penicillium rubens Wisconsin 54-1255]KAF3015494.1 hypothetical protein E8E15_005787 [Penicillium rubens]KAJ5053101.1 hypothetical protein NUH16_010161 [Penicillium rubens]KAJ5253019.1 hypothetical protein N7489_003429 [Penicillium chrysogenum]KAJ5253672.1 hypothetical protein N7524_010852 [Penicillium chrysogenum]